MTEFKISKSGMEIPDELKIHDLYCQNITAVNLNADNVDMDEISLTLGSGAAPSLNFVDDADTGIYSSGANAVNISTGGTSRLHVSTTAVTSSVPVVVPDGAVGAPGLAFSGDLNTGIYSSADETLDITTSGANRLSVSTGAVTSTVPVVIPDGAVDAPGLAFSGDLNTGIYSSADETVNVTTNGVNRLSVSSSGVSSTVPVVIPDGAVGAPGLAFSGDLNTGIYSSADETVDIATNGVNRLSVSVASVTSTLPIYAPSGTESAPGIAFASDLNNNTGFYLSGADDIGLTAGGSIRGHIASTGISLGGLGTPIQKLHFGTQAITFSLAGEATTANIGSVSFSSTFSSTPIVLLTMTSAGTNPPVILSATSITTSGFNVQAVNVFTTPISNADITVMWTAMN